MARQTTARRQTRRLAGSLLVLGAGVAPLQAVADTLFHVSEVVAEDEVRPRQARHFVRWDGDYYVTERDVSVSGWGSKVIGKPIPFDEPQAHTSREGTPFVSVFHKLPNGIQLTIDYPSFVLDRRVEQTGPQSCRLVTTATLKPGHSLFEVHRLSNHEPMFETSRTFTALRCELPKLIG